jgi:hypothetical protein
MSCARVTTVAYFQTLFCVGSLRKTGCKIYDNNKVKCDVLTAVTMTTIIFVMPCSLIYRVTSQGIDLVIIINFKNYAKWAVSTRLISSSVNPCFVLQLLPVFLNGFCARVQNSPWVPRSSIPSNVATDYVSSPKFALVKVNLYLCLKHQVLQI